VSLSENQEDTIDTVRILCVGGGPAGLYFALLHKKARPADDVLVVEQNRADATYGWGVVFSDKALTFLDGSDARFMADLRDRLERWDDLTVVHCDEAISIDGHGFTAIARLELLQLLQRHCAAAAVEMRFETRVERVTLDDFDLVVGSDGVGSRVRHQFAAHFEPASRSLSNKYIWYGTGRVFDTLSLIFREFDGGFYVAHAYRFSPRASTFLVECDVGTWSRVGFSTMNDEESRAYCARIFARELQGHQLMSNKSAWTSFTVSSNARWSHRNAVLVGDALRSVHFSIGSGTRLALEDAIALHRAIQSTGTISQALDAFEAARRPIVEKIIEAAGRSAEWYERFHERMTMAPHEFTMSYATRSGRVSRGEIEQTSPRFSALYNRRSADKASSGMP
jgi:2-polyprenyl-6-methoxyphenol hydroxylase-like FAD-dependent oxidoreductase